jgi:hypothetical protein
VFFLIATAHGDGVYFATFASYSVQDTYSVPDSNGNKRIYMCKVLTGQFTNGNRGMRIPPIIYMFGLCTLSTTQSNKMCAPPDDGFCGGILIPRFPLVN